MTAFHGDRYGPCSDVGAGLLSYGRLCLFHDVRHGRDDCALDTHLVGPGEVAVEEHRSDTVREGSWQHEGQGMAAHKHRSLEHTEHGHRSARLARLLYPGRLGHYILPGPCHHRRRRTHRQAANGPGYSTALVEQAEELDKRTAEALDMQAAELAGAHRAGDHNQDGRQQPEGRVGLGTTAVEGAHSFQEEGADLLRTKGGLHVDKTGLPPRQHNRSEQAAETAGDGKTGDHRHGHHHAHDHSVLRRGRRGHS